MRFTWSNARNGAQIQNAESGFASWRVAALTSNARNVGNTSAGLASIQRKARSISRRGQSVLMRRGPCNHLKWHWKWLKSIWVCLRIHTLTSKQSWSVLTVARLLERKQPQTCLLANRVEECSATFATSQSLALITMRKANRLAESILNTTKISDEAWRQEDCGTETSMPHLQLQSLELCISGCRLVVPSLTFEKYREDACLQLLLDQRKQLQIY